MSPSLLWELSWRTQLFLLYERLCETGRPQARLVASGTVSYEETGCPHSRCFGATVLKAADLNPREWCPRELRHTFVSLMSDHDVPIEKISILVGHASTKITETVYRHQLKPEIRDGAEHMNDIFASKTVKSA